MVYIRVKDGPHKGRVYSVADEAVYIGRDNDVPIQIMDQGVSRKHAEIFRVGEMFFIRDLKSRNGTYVNEQLITEELLCEGDRIRIGQTTLVFDATAPSAQEEVGQIEYREVEADPGATMEIRFGVMDYADIEEPVTSETKEPGGEVASLRSQRHLSVLYQVARAISSRTDAKSMLSDIIKLCSEAVRAEDGFIFVKGDSGEAQELNLEASYQKEGSPASVVSTTIVKRVTMYGRAVLTADAGADRRFKGTDSVVMKGLKSVICAPLVGPPDSAEKVIGVAYLTSSGRGKVFSVEDFELITAIGIQTGIALSNIKIASEQRKTFTSIIATLVSAVEMRDPALKGRSERVADLALAIAQALGMPHEERNSLHIAALLYNIGHLLIPEADIQHAQAAGDSGVKEESLDFKQAHCAEELLKNIKGLREILPAVKHSFEKFDGTGSPDGLAGKEIPLHARIIATARAFNEVLADASQADKLTAKEALLALSSRAQQGEIDPELVKALAIAYRMGLLV